MLFMVIEHFRDSDDLARVGERFKLHGRMLPQEVRYHASWMTSSGDRCFQLMEAPAAESLGEWVDHWNDLMTFEVVPVLESSDFWRKSAPPHR